MRDIQSAGKREEALQRLASEEAALRGRCDDVLTDVEQLLPPRENGAPPTCLGERIRSLGSKIREAVEGLQRVWDTARPAPARGKKGSDEAVCDGFFKAGMLPEHICEVLRSHAVRGVESPIAGDDRGGDASPAARGRREPGQAILVDLMFAKAEVELLLALLTKPETAILIAAGVELASFTSHALFPCFCQAVNYLFTFLLEQLQAQQDLAAAPLVDRSLMGLVSGLGALGIDPSFSQDISQLCARQGHVAILLRRQRILEGAAVSARLTSVQARRQLGLLQWCHLGSCLHFEAVQFSARQGRSADIWELLQLRGLKALETTPVEASTLMAALQEAPADHPVTLVSALVRAHGGLRRAVDEATTDPLTLLCQAGDLTALVSEVLHVFTGGLDPRGEGSCISDQSWVRSATKSLHMLQESNSRQASLQGQLQGLRGGSVPQAAALGGNEAALAQTLQESSKESERLEALRLTAHQQLEAFLERHQRVFGSALSLAQPSLEGSADALQTAACAVVNPLQHFRKVLGGTRGQREATSSRGAATAAAAKEVRTLSDSVAALGQQCELWLATKGGRSGAAQAPGGRPNLPAPPSAAPPPPPPPPPDIPKEPQMPRL